MTDRPPMTDLADFLLARIAEEEQLARDSADCQHEPHPNWQALITDDEGATIVEDCGCVVAQRPWDAVVPGYEAEHVARWDPARVLAECEAKRQIVGLHRRGAPRVTFGGGYDPELNNRCTEGCGQDGISHDDVYYIKLYTRPRWPCATLRLLALPYADHPDYDEEWRP